MLSMMLSGQRCEEKPVEDSPWKDSGEESLSRGVQSRRLHALPSHLHLPIPTAAAVAQQCRRGEKDRGPSCLC